MTRFIIILVFFLIVFALAIQNMDHTVEIKYLFGYKSFSIPVYLLVIGALLFGMVMTVFLLLPEWIKNRLQLRRHERTLHRLESELRRGREDDVPENGPDLGADDEPERK